MSQHWHGHWTEEAFRPVRLKNWEVPNWHPCWPDKHCRVTQFMADNHGRILVGQKRSTESPWGHFKGTWELPKKISRQEARELSAPPRHKINIWEEHKKINRAICKSGEMEISMKRKKKQSSTAVSPKDFHGGEAFQESKLESPLKLHHIPYSSPKTTCAIHHTCQI